MAKNTIKIKKYSDIVEEYSANAAITPGHLIEIMSTGYVRKHAGAAQDVLPMFALEDELQGKGIDDDFAQYDRVQCWIPNRGDIVNAILADGQDIEVGEMLVSNGDGTLKVYDPAVNLVDSVATGNVYRNIIVGVAVTDLDLSGSAGADALVGNRIQVRIL